MQLSYRFSGKSLSHRRYARGHIRENYRDYPSMVQLFVVVESYIGGHLRVYPQLCVGASRVDFGLVIMPIPLDQTIDCTHSGDDYKLVSLVSIIFRYLHKVMVKGSLTVPGTDIGQTHSGSMEGKYTIIAWKLEPR
jgi:hypothetical protein